MNIPKILHSYLDNKPVSLLRLVTYFSFKEHNPDWKLIIYSQTEPKESVNLNKLRSISDIRILDLESIGCPKDLRSSSICDYIKYYTLAKYGGLWTDSDIVFTNPINQLIDSGEVLGDKANINTVISYNGNTYFTALLLANENNDLFNFLLKNCPKYFDKTNELCLGGRMINSLFGPIANIKSNLPTCNILNITPKTYIPYSYGDTSLYQI